MIHYYIRRLARAQAQLDIATKQESIQTPATAALLHEIGQLKRTIIEERAAAQSLKAILRRHAQ
jgi:hypothetical protein